MPKTVLTLRTSTPGRSPVPGSLQPGQFAIEMADPTRLWVGVPGGAPASQQKLLLSSSAADMPLGGKNYLPLAGGAVTGVTSFTPSISVANGTSRLSLSPGLGGGSYNPLLQTGDAALIGDAWAVNTGALTLMPWSSSALGIRMDNVAKTIVLTATGAITVSADPTAAMGIATKQYVDAKVSTGVGAYLPLTGGSLSGGLNVNGTLQVGSPTLQQVFQLNGPVNSARDIRWATAGSLRWLVRLNTQAEATGDTGANIDFISYTNAGAVLKNPVVRFNRTGLVGFYGGVAINTLGLSFPGGAVTSHIDLSKHISLFGNVYGFSISASRLNYVVPANASHLFVVNSVDTVTINSGGLIMGAAKPLTLGMDPTAAMHATPKQYVDAADQALQREIDVLAEDMFFAGGINVVTDVCHCTIASGLVDGIALPAPSVALKGFYFIVTNPGQSKAGNIPSAVYALADWLACDGAQWIQLPLGQANIIASQVAISPAIGALGANVQTGLSWLNTNKFNITGGTVSGVSTFQSTLNVYANTVLGETAVARNYILYIQTPAGFTRYIQWRSGAVVRWQMGVNSTAEVDPQTGSDWGLYRYANAGTYLSAPLQFSRETGLGTVQGDPTSAFGIATKQYADTKLTQATADGRYLKLAGGTLTGFLTLHAPPTAALHAATKAYVDSAAAGGGSGVYLPLAGGTMTGGILFGSRTGTGPDDVSKHLALWGTGLGIGITGARQNYVVDVNSSHWFRVGGADKVQIGSGGITMHSPLTLQADPTAVLHAATKQYVDAKVATGGAFVPLAGGTMTGKLWITLAATATTEHLFLRPTNIAAQETKLRFGGTFTGASGEYGARLTTSLRSGMTGSWGTEYLDVWVNHAPNDATSDATQSRIIRFQNALVTVDKPTTFSAATTLVGASSFRNGISFNNAVADVPTNLDKHVKLYNGYGMSVTGNTLNIVGGPNIDFYPGGAQVVKMTGTGLAMIGNTRTVTLTMDPTANLHAVPKQYVDAATNALQTQIDVLAEDMFFAGGINVVTDICHCTIASGLVDGIALPAASAALKGFYFIVTNPGQSKAGNIPSAVYALADWIACDGIAWIQLPLGQANIIASQVAISPAIGSLGANVQTGLGWLNTNKLNLTGGTMTGHLQVGTATATAGIYINGPAAVGRWFWMRTGVVTRWVMGANTTAEAEPQTGSDWQILRYNNAGAGLGAVLTFTRATGLGTVFGDPTAALGIATKQYVDTKVSTGTGAYLPLAGGTMTGKLNAAALSVNGWFYSYHNAGGTLPAIGAGLYVSWNYSSGGREVNLWNGDTATTGVAFRFHHLTSATTQKQLIDINVAGGISFGSRPAVSGANDNSAHIQLWGTSDGFNITSGRLNYNTGSAHYLRVLNVDQLKVDTAGMTMLNGAITLKTDPTAALHAATKQYVDAKVSTGGAFLPLAGGTLTGFLTLHADPTAALHAATKQYADLKMTQATADGRYVNIAGDTMTGNLLLGTATAGGSALYIQGLSASNRLIWLRTGSLTRWAFGANAIAESTGNIGSDFIINSYNDAGGVIGNPVLRITRSSSMATFYGGVTFSTTSAHTGAATFASTMAVTGVSTFTGKINANGGLKFFDAVGASATDLSKHIALHSTAYGFSVTGGTVNHVSGGTIAFYPNAAGRVAYMNVNGIFMDAAKAITLSGNPTAALHAAPKQYIDAADANLQMQIDVLAEDLYFVGGIDVVADVGNFTIASGIPNGTALPAPAVAYKGFFVIVTQGGTAKAGNIPPGVYSLSDWIVCDGAQWVWLKIGEAKVIAQDVEIVPLIGSLGANVQTGLGWLNTNKFNITGGTVSGVSTFQSTLNVTGNIVAGLQTGGHYTIYLQGATATNRYIQWRTAASVRWQMGVNNTAEVDPQTGSDFGLYRYSNTGAYLNAPLLFSRATGLATVTGDPTVPLGIATKQYADTKLTQATADGRYVNITGDTVTGNFQVGTATATAGIYINGPAASNRWVYLRTNTTALVTRWAFGANNAVESTGNVGSDFVINSYNDAGALLHTAVTITRSTGLATIKADPTTALGIATKQYVDTKAGAYVPLAGGVMTGALSVHATLNVGNATTAQIITINGPINTNRDIRFYANTQNRWLLRMNAIAEGAGNVGANFDFITYDNAGAVIKNPAVRFERTGLVRMYTGLVVAGGFVDGAALRAASSVAIAAQGAHMMWNRVGGSGAQYFVNHRGGGYGGFIFIDTDGTTDVQLLDIDRTSVTITTTVGAWGAANYGKQLIIQGTGTNPSIGIADSAGANYIALTNAAGKLVISEMGTLAATTGQVNMVTVDGVGTTFHTGGIAFGNAAVSVATDLSKHIRLYATTFGFSITGSTLNVVSGGNIGMWATGAGRVANFNVNGLGMDTGKDITLSRDPTTALHAATKQYVDNHATSTVYVKKTGDTMSGNLTVAVAAATGAVITASHSNAYAEIGAYPGGGLLAVGGNNSSITMSGFINAIGAYKQDHSTGRWSLALGNGSPESGADVGSDLAITRYSDTGVTLANNAFVITRKTGDLTIQAAAYKPGGGSWAATSDIRIKDVLGTYDHGLDAILKLRPITYRYRTNWKSGYSTGDAGAIYVGLVAQEVEAVMPEMVGTMAGEIDDLEVDDIRTLDLTALPLAIVNAIKELSAQNTALAARVATLEARTLH